MDDDLNTAGALGHVFGMVRLMNRLLEDKAVRNKEGFRQLIERFFKLADAWSDVLGVFGVEPTAFLEGLRDIRALRSGIDMEKVKALLAERAEARAAKDFARSDAARDALAAMGVEVRDTPSGAVWDIA
jgi:cysteinyl-tRNA synthetase